MSKQREVGTCPQCGEEHLWLKSHIAAKHKRGPSFPGHNIPIGPIFLPDIVWGGICERCEGMPKDGTPEFPECPRCARTIGRLALMVRFRPEEE